MALSAPRTLAPAHVADEPRVAAIIVNYRTPELTAACVQSLRASIGVRPHVIVVDNASGDDSLAVLRRQLTSPDVIIEPRSVNDGYTGGNNAGVRIARRLGVEWVLVLNSDTIVDEHCLAALLTDATAHASCGAATPRIFLGRQRDRLWYGGGRYSLFTGRPVHIGAGGPAQRGWAKSSDVSFVSGCALLVRLGVVEGDLFDDSLFAYAEDVDLSLRLRRSGLTLRYVPAAVVWHYEGSSHGSPRGQSLRWYLNARNLLRVAARHARWYHWPVLAPMLALNVVARFSVVALRNRDGAALRAVWRGAAHALMRPARSWSGLSALASSPTRTAARIRQ